MKKITNKTVINDFGLEWKKFSHKNIDEKILYKMFIDYFRIFPFKKINYSSEGFDMGAGTGRWAKFIAPKVKKLNIIEPGRLSIQQAKKNLSKFSNCVFYNQTVEKNFLKDNSQDFGYCLGVLHHIENTELGIKSCIKKLKSGAPFLFYLYYDFDNKSHLYKLIWKFSDVLRKKISALPFFIKYMISQIIALMIYYPLAKASFLLDCMNVNTSNIPLSYYRNKSFYMMRTDSLDRFGTRVEKRFSKKKIKSIMVKAGLINIKFSDKAPFWVGVGYKN